MINPIFYSARQQYFLTGVIKKLLRDGKVTVMVGADLLADRADLLRRAGDVPSHPVAFASCTHQMAFLDGPVSPGVGNA